MKPKNRMKGDNPCIVYNNDNYNSHSNTGWSKLWLRVRHKKM